MAKEIVINTDSQKTRIAIVENGSLAELFIETEEYERTIGNLFLGRVRRIMPSIQAAFVDIGQKQDAFLHYSDLADNLGDWLKFVQEDNPRIGEFKPELTQRPKGRRRRRPQHGRHRSQRQDEDGGDDSRSGEKGHHVAGSRSRGKRRSAQRRKSSGGGRGDRGGSNRDSRPSGEALPSTLLKRDQAILVKISKEPIAQKGSRITTDISLAGRFLVLVPMADYVAVSKKISSFKERRRLRALARMLVPDGFGVIVRTVAEGQNAKALDTDLRLLIDRWRKIEKRLSEHPKPPAPVHQDVNMVSSIIRDLFSDNYERILIDSQRLYRNIKSYVQAVAPDMVDLVKLHESDEPVFKVAGIDKKVSEAFERRVNMPSGGYLFFEQTEAMHVVDVNSGRAGRGMSQEDSSLKVNLEAARIIARQIRIRDLGGIIVVDFIDMRDERSRRKVYEELKREFRRDRAVTKLLPMSDFGLIQITRQRLRPSITSTFSDSQGNVGGNGDAGAETRPAPAPKADPKREPTVEVLPTPVKSAKAGATLTPEQLVEALDDWIRAYRATGRKDPVRLQVHPFVAAFLNRRVPNQSTRWFIRFRQRVRVESVPTIDPLAYRFLDGETGNDLTFVPKKDDDTTRRQEAPQEDAKPERSRSGRDGNRRSGGGRQGGGSRGGGGRGQGRGRGSSQSGSNGGDRRRGQGGSGQKDESAQQGKTGSDRDGQDKDSGGSSQSGGSRRGRRRGGRGGRGRSRGRSSGSDGGSEQKGGDEQKGGRSQQSRGDGGSNQSRGNRG